MNVVPGHAAEEVCLGGQVGPADDRRVRQRSRDTLARAASRHGHRQRGGLDHGAQLGLAQAARLRQLVRPLRGLGAQVRPPRQPGVADLDDPPRQLEAEAADGAEIPQGRAGSDQRDLGGHTAHVPPQGVQATAGAVALDPGPGGGHAQRRAPGGRGGAANGQQDHAGDEELVAQVDIDGVVGRQNLGRPQAARSYTWCKPFSTGRDRMGPAPGRDRWSGVCKPSVRWGRSSS
jgi:hypothetical protein